MPILPGACAKIAPRPAGQIAFCDLTPWQCPTGSPTSTGHGKAERDTWKLGFQYGTPRPSPTLASYCERSNQTGEMRQRGYRLAINEIEPGLKRSFESGCTEVAVRRDRLGQNKASVVQERRYERTVNPIADRQAQRRGAVRARIIRLAKILVKHVLVHLAAASPRWEFSGLVRRS